LKKCLHHFLFQKMMRKKAIPLSYKLSDIFLNKFLTSLNQNANTKKYKKFLKYFIRFKLLIRSFGNIIT
jgi:hypothetical protein